MNTTPQPPAIAYDASLGREARTGTWEQLAQGTFRTAATEFRQGRHARAAALVRVALLEAEELHDVFERWPDEILNWLRARSIDEYMIEAATTRLAELIGRTAMNGIDAEWHKFAHAVEAAAAHCLRGEPTAPDAIELARKIWRGIHDRAVDRVAGIIDIAVRTAGEDTLGAMWDFLMADWYAIHAQRYALENQAWDISAHQLMVAIVDGMHAHLTGSTRQGDLEVIEEEDRIGFRFVCGSGARGINPEITGGKPRSGPPYEFAVTTEQHDWAWNTEGICSYCVHCCLLNEVMPIDRLGYPTRVIDPPTWPASSNDARCTWWVYRHPSLVPDSVYHRIGRDPSVRPSAPRAKETDDV